MPVEIRLAKENPNDTTAEIVRWLVDDGQWVNADDDVVEVESTKAVMTIAAGADGYLKRLVDVKDIVEIGALLALVYPTREELAAHVPPAGSQAGSGDPVGRGGRGDTGDAAADAPDARFSASGHEELVRLGLDPKLFAGQGLVTARMVRRLAAELGGGARAATTGGTQVSGRDPAAPEVQQRPLGPAKQTEISRLTAGAAALSSSLTVGFASAPLRASLLKRTPVQPLVLAVIIEGLARTLADFPDLNARFAGSHIESYTRVNVGVAVDFGNGLRVPVIKDADRLDATEITFALLDAMAAYHERRLSAADVSGATVTVSDLSGDDILQFQPRINQDQTLALGVGGDSTLPGHPMTLTAVFDHRVSTGRTVAQFLRRLKDHLTGEAER